MIIDIPENRYQNVNNPKGTTAKNKEIQEYKKIAEYLEYLKFQYQSATNQQYQQTDESFKGFYQWIREQKLISLQYLDVLDYIQKTYDSALNYKDSTTAEIDKGCYDSIVLMNGTTTMITPYVGPGESWIKDISKNPLINAEFKALITPRQLNLTNINRFMTQNPYTEKHLKNWEEIHNSGKNITVGVFGHIYDYDKDEKILWLNKLIEQMQSNSNHFFKIENITNQDCYIYIVSSVSKSNWNDSKKIIRNNRSRKR